jgi:hypothetical protein
MGRLFFFGFALAAVAAVAPACSAFGDECNVGEVRCNGSVVEACVKEGTSLSDGDNPLGGYAGPVSLDPGRSRPLDHDFGDDDEHDKSSPKHVWVEKSDCGAPDLCVSPAGQKPFCALAAQPDPACAAPPKNGLVCEGTSLVACRAGYAVESLGCGTCESKSGCALRWSVDSCCAGGFFSTCSTDAECGGGAGTSCVETSTRGKRCTRPCSCPDGQACESECGGLLRAPNTKERVLCVAGACVEDDGI